MAVNFDPLPTLAAVENPSPNPPSKPAPTSGSKTVEAPAGSSPEQAVQAVSEGYLSPNVTFRRDSNGQVYYVLTDSQSGKELREVPPAKIRSVSQGIEEFLKSQEEHTNSHIEVKV